MRERERERGGAEQKRTIVESYWRELKIERYRQIEKVGCSRYKEIGKDGENIR